jgi:hypothetical protein
MSTPPESRRSLVEPGERVATIKALIDGKVPLWSDEIRFLLDHIDTLTDRAEKAEVDRDNLMDGDQRAVFDALTAERDEAKTSAALYLFEREHLMAERDALRATVSYLACCEPDSDAEAAAWEAVLALLPQQDNSPPPVEPAPEAAP